MFSWFSLSSSKLFLVTGICFLLPEKYDDTAGAPFYTNSSSGEVVWQIPQDESKLVNLGSAFAATAEDNATCNTAAIVGEWIECWDDEAGAVFYQHAATGEVAWDIPAAEAQSNSSLLPDAFEDGAEKSAPPSAALARTFGRPPGSALVPPVGSGPAAARSLRGSIALRPTDDPGTSSAAASPPKSLPPIVPPALLTKPAGPAPHVPHYPPVFRPLDLQQPLKPQLLGKGSFDGSSTQHAYSPASFSRNNFLIGHSISTSIHTAID